VRFRILTITASALLQILSILIVLMAYDEMVRTQVRTILDALHIAVKVFIAYVFLALGLGLMLLSCVLTLGD